MHNLNFIPKDSSIKGFQEVIFSVSSLERSIDFFKRICGWEVLHQGQCDADLKSSWRLGESVEIQEALLRNPGDIEGFLRIVQFKNVAQEQIRSAAHVWDYGGIFDINIRTHDMATLYREFQNEGWNGYADPLHYTFGIYEVIEVLLKGPDGVTIAAMQRLAPPLEGFTHMKKTSRIFNSSIITADIEVSRDFYVNKLGFHMFFQTPGIDRKAGHNVIGLPQNLNKDITVPVDIVRPDKNAFGSLEFLEIKELKGKDCSTLAKPPNLGILMYRFPVKNAEAYAATLKERGVALNSEIQTVQIAPYGDIKLFSVRSPEGVWLEFVELVTP